MTNTDKDIRLAHDQQHIKLAVDNCIFTVRGNALCILLIQMKDKFAGQWALPGGLVDDSETTDAAALRILEMQTGVDDAYLEQLYTFSRIDRDPLNRVVSVAYVALMSSENTQLHTTSKYAAVAWVPCNKLPPLAYDHQEIVSHAARRLKAKIGYSNVAWSLLPEQFTLSQLQQVYESILNQQLDKRNFRKKLLSINLIKSVGKKNLSGAHRPAELYRFVGRELKIVDIL